ncbi:MAG: flagellar biosynthetic protein FliR [Balneolaceae bacterium]
MESFLSADYLISCFLIFTRVGAMIMTAPFFSSAAFPSQVKLFFALITSVLLYPVIPGVHTEIPMDAGWIYVSLAIGTEVLIGVAMGLVGQLIMAGLEMAGRLISLKIVLAFAELVDSMTQQRSTLVSNLFTMLALLVFLAMDGDKLYINALARSFEVIPLNQSRIELAGPFMLEVATYLFLIAVQIASPFMILLFLLDLSLAIFARIMPQANVMFIALPLKLGVGFALLLWVLPWLPVAFEMMFDRMFEFLELLLEEIMPAG